jgi:hypothetical protein
MPYNILEKQNPEYLSRLFIILQLAAKYQYLLVNRIHKLHLNIDQGQHTGTAEMIKLA